MRMPVGRSGVDRLVLDFYGLLEQPFGATPDPRFTYLAGSYREALASICVGLQAGHGLLALIAPPGLGKTMVLFHLIEHLRRSTRTAFLFHTRCDDRGLLRQIIAQLGGSTDRHDVVALHGALQAILLQEARLGRRVVLIIDEAHNLSAPVLETVRLLSDFETSTRKLLQIVVAGQPALAQRLIEPELAALTQRISTVARIGPLTESETLAYVKHRFKVGGRVDADLVDQHALRLVARAAKGVPREINTVLSSALHLGCAVGSQSIGSDVIEEVLHDRDLRPLCTAAAGDTPALAPGRPPLSVACAV